MTDDRSAIVHAVLAWSLRTYFHGGAVAAAVQPEAIQWDGLLWLARQHHVQPLVYYSLHTYCASMIPPAMQQPLHAMYRAHCVEALLQMRDGITALDHLHTHQVQAIPLFGGIMAQLTYGHMTFRASRSRTLRFILHAVDIPRARQLLSTLGYDERGLSHTSSPHRLRFYVDTTGQDRPSGPERALCWTRLQTFRVSGRDMLVLAPEDWLLFLCGRGTQHRWRRWCDVCDVAALLMHNPTLDWTYVLEQAGQQRVTRSVFLGLRLAGLLCDRLLPEAIRVRLEAEPAVTRLAAQCLAHLYGRQTPASGLMTQLQYELDLRQGLYAKSYCALRYSVDQLRRLAQHIGGRAPSTHLGTYEPTPPIVARRLLQLAGVSSTDMVYDLGCGDGRIVILAAQEFGARGVGLDIEPAHITAAQTNAAAAGVEQMVQLRVEDVMRAKLDTATVVMIYLPESAYPRLLPKLRQQLRPGTRVVSHDSSFPYWLPEKVEILSYERVKVAHLYLWRMP